MFGKVKGGLPFAGWAAAAETLTRIMEVLMARQRKSFGQQWQLAEVRIITVAGNDVGWLQTTPANDAIFLGQLYLEGRFQWQGIGSRVMRAVIDEATPERKAVTLGVVKINPEFGTNLDDLIKLAKSERIAIMCAEAVPWRCHRSLIADALLARAIEVREITSVVRTRLQTLTPWGEGERNAGHLSC